MTKKPTLSERIDRLEHLADFLLLMTAGQLLAAKTKTRHGDEFYAAVKSVAEAILAYSGDPTDERRAAALGAVDEAFAMLSDAGETIREPPSGEAVTGRSAPGL